MGGVNSDRCVLRGIGTAVLVGQISNNSIIRRDYSYLAVKIIKFAQDIAVLVLPGQGNTGSRVKTGVDAGVGTGQANLSEGKGLDSGFRPYGEGGAYGSPGSRVNTRDNEGVTSRECCTFGKCNDSRIVVGCRSLRSRPPDVGGYGLFGYILTVLVEYFITNRTGLIPGLHDDIGGKLDFGNLLGFYRYGTAVFAFREVSAGYSDGVGSRHQVGGGTESSHSLGIIPGYVQNYGRSTSLHGKG
ncbi:histidinol-phosphate/aromatic aminotransferase and cobyric acid decarboxylase [Moorella thermoacetica Y72]|uniref:Histidinol-phosphate/aromatic aminotransferase and cobyric acid decarboxylase n=1 Tax=Moorella thermoacetica Y72 TaxID=1325331 RepID=A0A0S6UE43_NEOTH|nr:histidinol-phosphate/aromatic aminotransferase and cobyric acid decarboxylase [Moorella thermoacetica Y72]